MQTAQRSERYVRLLLWLLVPAAFFNGFDGELRALLLPQLQRSFHVGVATIGLANIPIGAGQFVAFFAVRLADRVGRRPLLLVSLFGYALFSGLTAASFSVWSFAVFQGLAQVFIGTEYAVSVLVIAEEVAPEQRGRALSRLLVAAPAGVVATAALLAAGLEHSSLGWRAFYLVGILPAIGIGLARRLIKETSAFTAARPTRERHSYRELARPPFRKRILALGMISFLEKIPVTAGAGWWVYYAERERHLSTTLVSLDLGTAFVLGMSGYFVCGWAIDRFGRRPIACVFLVGAFAAGLSLFHAEGELANFLLLVVAVFFGLGISPALSALSAECFPTEIRAEAGALVGNGFANTGELTGPVVVGLLGAKTGPIGSIGGAVSVLTPLLLLAAPILYLGVPETKGVNLDAPVDPVSTLAP